MMTDGSILTINVRQCLARRPLSPKGNFLYRHKSIQITGHLTKYGILTGIIFPRVFSLQYCIYYVDRCPRKTVSAAPPTFQLHNFTEQGKVRAEMAVLLGLLFLILTALANSS